MFIDKICFQMVLCFLQINVEREKYMRSFMSRLGYKLRIFMYGRYGFDELSKLLLFVSLACMLVSNIPYLRIFYFFALALIITVYFRVLSKNIPARTKESNKYYNIKNKLTKKFSVYKHIIKHRKTHRYFKCKYCGEYTRVPIGIGKVEVSCRVCKTKMIKKA